MPPTPDLFASVADAEAYSFHAPYLTKTPELYHPETRNVLQAGAKGTMAEYLQGRRDLDRLRRIIGRLFTGVDLLVTPTMPQPPLTIAECREAFQMSALTGDFNIYGLPAISIPCGLTSAGLPIGLQISDPSLWGGEYSRSRMPTSKRQVGTGGDLCCEPLLSNGMQRTRK